MTAVFRPGAPRLDNAVLIGCGVIGTVVILGLFPLAISRFDTYGTSRYFMGFGLILCWVVAGGLAQRRWRATLSDWLSRSDRHWRVAFVGAGVVLASIEEAVACLMTNLRSVFEDPTCTAFITASGNYLDLIFRHSVVVIVPMLIAWAWLLTRYRFTPLRVFVLFGAQGASAEVVWAGMTPVLFPVWLYVYGLMIWLPALAFQDSAERMRMGAALNRRT